MSEVVLFAEEVPPRVRSEASMRVEKHRDKVRGEGGCRMTVSITPAAKRALDELVAQGYAGSATAAINLALMEAKQRPK